MVRVNLLHPQPSLFLHGLLLSLWCFSILVVYYFQVSCNLNVILWRGVNRFSDRRIWPYKARGLWIFAVNRADSRTFNTVDRGSAVIFDADSGLCLSYVRILSPKRNLGQRSFFSLSRYVNEFIQIISFGIVLCYSHQACCLLYV